MLTTVVLFTYAALVSFGAFGTILSVGKPRPAVTPGVAALVALVSAVQVAGLAYLASQL